jgi:pimeloyl-ACP methyl ester carboxylesterase
MPVRAYVTTPDGLVHVDEQGEGDAVLLLHQNAHSLTMWEALLPELAGRGYRVVAIDLPGYGLSDPPPLQPDLAEYARRVHEAAGLLAIDRYGVVGQHLGASIALQLAVEHPEQVVGVVGLGLFADDPELRRAFLASGPNVYDRDGEQVLKQWQLRWQIGGPAFTPDLAVRCLVDELRAGTRRHFGIVALAGADHHALLAALERPYLVLGSRHDLLYAESRRAAALSPHATFHDLGEHGLFLADEAPAEYARLVDEHLETAATAAAPPSVAP